MRNNGYIYYAIKYSNDKIRIAENYSSATSYPAQHIDFLQVAGGGSFELAKVDPKINITKGTNVAIAVSDALCQIMMLNSILTKIIIKI